MSTPADCELAAAQWLTLAEANPPTTATGPQLYEGNYDAWIQGVERQLRKHGLWYFVQYAMSLLSALYEEQRILLERGDLRAVNIILESCEPAFLARRPIERPVTSYDLLLKLKQFSKPFRLMDLPRELRDLIYEASLVTRYDKRYYNMDTRQCEGYRPGSPRLSRQWRHPKIALSITTSYPPVLMQHQALLTVSKQVRTETEPIYWGQNEFQVNVDGKGHNEILDEFLRPPMRNFQKWVRLLGMHRLKHLTDFTLGVETWPRPGRREPEEFRFTTDSDGSLCLSLPLGGPGIQGIDYEVHWWHLAATELRVRSRGGKPGEAMIEFFMEQDWWETWFFSYPGGWDYESAQQQEEDEWWEDAYGPSNEWWSTVPDGWR